jgi:hypothetical protein
VVVRGTRTEAAVQLAALREEVATALGV